MDQDIVNVLNINAVTTMRDVYMMTPWVQIVYILNINAVTIMRGACFNIMSTYSKCLPVDALQL